MSCLHKTWDLTAVLLSIPWSFCRNASAMPNFFSLIAVNVNKYLWSYFSVFLSALNNKLIFIYFWRSRYISFTNRRVYVDNVPHTYYLYMHMQVSTNTCLRLLMHMCSTCTMVQKRCFFFQESRMTVFLPMGKKSWIGSLFSTLRFESCKKASNFFFKNEEIRQEDWKNRCHCKWQIRMQSCSRKMSVHKFSNLMWFFFVWKFE